MSTSPQGRADRGGRDDGTDGAQTPVRTVSCANCGRTNRVPAAAEGSPRCGNCRAPLPWIAEAGDADFEQVAEDLAGRIKLVKVDIDESPALARRFEVQAVPTLLVLDHGRQVARQTGAAPANALRHWVDESLSTSHGPADPAGGRP